MKKFFLSISLVCALCAAAATFADQTVLEVIPLRHRTAEEVIPIVQPFVERGGAVSGMQNQLIIRATPANLAQIRQLLASIDTAPRRLMITVKQDVDAAGKQREAEISGSIGNRARVTVPGSADDRSLAAEARRGDDSVRARVLSTQSLEADKNTQQLQALEGSRAFIRIGQSIPVPSRTVVRTPQGVQVIDSVQYQDATTAFYVVPRLSGDRVTLEVSPHRDTPGASGSFNIQQIHTTVSGRLGEWMDLGGLGQDRTEQQSGIGSRSAATVSEQRKVLIKVEEIR